MLICHYDNVRCGPFAAAPGRHGSPKQQRYTKTETGPGGE
ncbi:hypothetical protein ENTCAN_08351 [Enterobacter cancerogenus ATCC 35316]|nr:hypothetical protein ENTCAN_08351 [Enterobacter cancerogenus ATCC 35316]